VREKKKAVFLGFGVVSAQSQVIQDMLLRRSLAKTQKSALRTATLFFKPLYSISIYSIALFPTGTASPMNRRKPREQREKQLCSLLLKIRLILATDLFEQL